MKKEISCKRTKIVATLGPVSESVETLTQMMHAGLDVARLNFSHGTHAWHKMVIANIRQASEATGRPIALLADLQGPRIRTIVDKDLVIAKNDIVRICDVSLETAVCDQLKEDNPVIMLDCPGMVANLKSDHMIMIEDGLMTLRVIDRVDTHIVAKVVSGGTIKNHKGVNIPDAKIPLPTMTQKDHDDLAFALSQDVDYIALSFVRCAQDIVDLRTHVKKIVQRDTGLPKIIAKIERKEALRNLDGILGAVDGVMVARGDLGIEADPTKVTLFQKEIIAKSLQHLRPVIVATQMLASMEYNPRPTRAEVSDVTNAVIDHADATMLSAETTVGAYPVRTIETMAMIAIQTEASRYDDVDMQIASTISGEEVRVARGAYEFAREMEARAIVMYSETGYTARLLSHFRPERVVLVATNNPRTYRQLALIWGVTPFLCEHADARRKCIDDLISQAKERGLLVKDDLVVSILGSTRGGKRLELQGTRII